MNDKTKADDAVEQADTIATPVKRLVKCGCGGKLRYSHIVDDEEVMSCNKYIVCLTYQEQFEKILALNTEALHYKSVLERIVNVNGMDYEYKAWAKEALGT